MDHTDSIEAHFTLVVLSTPLGGGIQVAFHWALMGLLTDETLLRYWVNLYMHYDIVGYREFPITLAWKVRVRFMTIRLEQLETSWSPQDSFSLTS